METATVRWVDSDLVHAPRAAEASRAAAVAARRREGLVDMAGIIPEIKPPWARRDGPSRPDPAVPVASPTARALSNPAPQSPSESPSSRAVRSESQSRGTVFIRLVA